MSAAGFIAIVPARLASTRLPDKPLADICGKPMVVHVAERARQSGASAVIVATDHEDIARVVEASGFSAMMTREDHASGTDRIAEVAAAKRLADDAIVVNVQGDEPLLDATVIDACVEALQTHPDDVMSTARRPLADHEAETPAVVKVVTDADGAGRDLVTTWMRDLGLRVDIDGIGNVLGRCPKPGRKLLLGSHLETQNHAGWLDGALGCIYALETARVLGQGIDVAGWADEEGHFGPFLGTRSFVGALTDAEIEAPSRSVS